MDILCVGGPLRVGIIGSRGRLGSAIRAFLERDGRYQQGSCFHRSATLSLSDLFLDSDIVIDASSRTLTKEVLETAILHPKPLLICTTGWSKEELHPLIEKASQGLPLVIASNTTLGAHLQRSLAQKLALYLGEEFDIDIRERHHRKKIDTPSGTALDLFKTISEAKLSGRNELYDLETGQGPRSNRTIAISSERTAAVLPDYTVSFTNDDERISLRHTVLNARIFAKGALAILDWLAITPREPGLYAIEDTLPQPLTRK